MCGTNPVLLRFEAELLGQRQGLSFASPLQGIPYTQPLVAPKTRHRCTYFAKAQSTCVRSQAFIIASKLPGRWKTLFEIWKLFQYLHSSGIGSCQLLRVGKGGLSMLSQGAPRCHRRAHLGAVPTLVVQLSWPEVVIQ